MSTPKFLSLERPGRMRAYESLRYHPIDFSVASSRSISTPKQLDPQLAAFKKRISDLEDKVKFLENKLKHCHLEKAELREELEKMKEFNRKLISDNVSSSDSHYLVQKLLITQANEKYSDAQSEVEKLRQEAGRQKYKLNASQNNSKKLEGVLKQYRKFLSETLEQKRKLANSANEVELPKIKQLPPKKPSVSHTTNAFARYFNAINKETNLKALFSSAVEACRSIVKSKYCSIFIVNKKLQKEYSSLFSDESEIMRVIIGTSWILMHTDQEADYQPALFSKAEEVGKGITGADYFLYPLVYRKEMIAILQCEEVASTKEIGNFKLILAGLSQAINYYYSVNYSKQLKKYIDQTSNVMKIIGSSRTHQALSNAIHEHFPDLLGFQGASVVFVDESANEFYTNVPSSRENERYGYELVRYPSTLGICALTLASRNIKVFEDIKRVGQYSPEVDNLPGLKDSKTTVMTCIPSLGRVVGILVLGNKLESLKSEDLSMIENICKVLGSFISGVNDSVEALELTVRMKSCVDTLANGFNEDIGMEEMSQLRDLLKVMTERINILEAKMNNNS